MTRNKITLCLSDFAEKKEPEFLCRHEKVLPAAKTQTLLSIVAAEGDSTGCWL